MNHFKVMEKDGLISSDGPVFNAIALPSINNVKYVIDLENKHVFYQGLRMLSARSFKATLARVALHIGFRFRIIPRVLKANLILINKNSEILTLIQQSYKQALGLNLYFGGAKNQNFSMTIQVVEHDKEYYLRYPISELSKQCAANEFKNINYIYSKGLGNIVQRLDKVISFRTDTIYSYEGISSYTTATHLCENKIKLLRELSGNDFRQFKSNIFFQELNVLIAGMIHDPKYNWINNISNLYQSTIDILSPLFVKTAFYHGDFSPDNILISGGRFYLIDFEYSNCDFFSCFDLFHYLYKAQNLHLKVITLDDINSIDFYIKHTYSGYPFYDELKQKESVIVKYLFIFYLFLLLKRYVLDERLHRDNDILLKVQQSIFNLST